MRKKVAGVVLAALVALGCGAWASTKAATARQSRPVVHVHRLPIRRTGVGSESLGTFAMHGWIYLKATCVGTGTFGVDYAATSSNDKDGASRACLDSNRKPTLKTGSNFGVYIHRAKIDVSAPAGMKWSVIVFEDRWTLDLRL